MSSTELYPLNDKKKKNYEDTSVRSKRPCRKVFLVGCILFWVVIGTAVGIFVAVFKVPSVDGTRVTVNNLGVVKPDPKFIDIRLFVNLNIYTNITNLNIIELSIKKAYFDIFWQSEENGNIWIGSITKQDIILPPKTTTDVVLVADITPSGKEYFNILLSWMNSATKKSYITLTMSGSVSVLSLLNIPIVTKQPIQAIPIVT